MEKIDHSDYLLPLKSIRVTELSDEVTETLLFEKFSTIGPILSLHLHRDPIKQICNGVAHITYYSSDDARQAFDTLNNDLMLNEPMLLYWAEQDDDISKYRVESFFVENLNINIDDEGVETLFVSYGKILYCTVNRDSDGNSLSSAYVHYKNGCKLKELMKNLDGSEINNQIISIHRIQALDDIPFTNIYVKYLSSDTENVDLHKMFMRFGAINSCVVIRNPDGTSKRFGFVNFEEPRAAKNAVEDMHLSSNSQQQIIHVTRADRKPTIQSSLRYYEEKLGKPVLTYLFVDNIGAMITELQIRLEFEKFLNLIGVKRIRNQDKFYAYVFYKDPKSAIEAIRLMAKQMHTLNRIKINVVNRFEHPSFFRQTCAIPVIVDGFFNAPETNWSWKLFWQVNIIPACEKKKKWNIYQLCRAERI